MEKHSISLIFLAGGQSTRMNSMEPKQFALLGKKTLALHSFDTISTLSAIDEMIVVCKTPYQAVFPKAVKFALPGDSRQLSTFNGLKKVSHRSDFVLIHDAARPLIPSHLLDRLIEGVAMSKCSKIVGAVPVLPLVELMSKQMAMLLERHREDK